jgi:ATP-dependent protease ClpP protease subunit
MAPTSPAPPLYIAFTAGVDKASTDRVIATLIDALSKGTREAHLMISTTGGGIMNGMTLFNFLRQFPVTLTTYNIGNVDSVGNVIFLAGERRIASPQSTFMFHGVAYNVTGPMSLAEPNLIEMLGVVQADQNRMADIIAQRTQIARDDAAHLFSHAATKTAAEALAVGIIHEIAAPVVPPDASVVLIAA